MNTLPLISATHAAYNGPTGKRTSETDFEKGGTAAHEAEEGIYVEVPVVINERRKKRRLTKRKLSIPLDASPPVDDPTAADVMSVTGEISPVPESPRASVSQTHLPLLEGGRTLEENLLEVEIVSVDDSDDTILNYPSDFPLTTDDSSAEHPLCDDLIAKLDDHRQRVENAVILHGESWVSRYRVRTREMFGRSIANNILRASDCLEDEVEARVFEIFKTRWTNAEDRRKDAQAAQDMATMRKRDLNGARKQLMAAQSAVGKATAAVVEANNLFAAAEDNFREAKRILFRSLSE
ncbi:hypothetical protein BGZ94_000814 [Podila epigama]|nr:hypothetical protein BGZ94_000814 [Podila epigama]